MAGRRNLSGVYRKAVIAFSAAFNAAGGSAFLADWQLDGKIAPAVARGAVTGLVTGAITAVATAYVPNDARSTAETPPVPTESLPAPDVSPKAAERTLDLLEGSPAPVTLPGRLLPPGGPPTVN